ncbi:MAG: DUF2306 domain-containing protein [Paracoccaceae bacterium]
MFEPLVTAPLEIQLHVAFAMMSILLGPLALFRKRRDWVHKTLGYVWVWMMALTALSSMFIMEVRSFGPFSIIHLLSLLTFWGLFRGVRFALHRNIPAHRATMQNMYFWALGIAGILSFLPGRIMSRIFATQGNDMDIMLIASSVAVAFGIIRYVSSRPKPLGRS